MNHQIRDEWVRRLRSGEYKQGIHFLKKHELAGFEYYCLGVLCEIAEEEGIVGSEQHMTSGITSYYALDDPISDRDSKRLPDAVIRWAELPTDTKYPATVVVDGATLTTLASMNDDFAPFEEIADTIEERL